MDSTKLFTILHIVVCVLLIAVVLFQEGKDPGMKGIVGSSGDNGDSFFSKNTGRTKAAFLARLTAVLSILFLVTTVALFFATK